MRLLITLLALFLVATLAALALDLWWQLPVWAGGVLLAGVLIVAVHGATRRG